METQTPEHENHIQPVSPQPGRWEKLSLSIQGNPYLALLIVVLLSIALRVSPTLTSPGLERMVSLPVLTEHDGYLYLRYASEFCEGRFHEGEVDAARGVFNGLVRGDLPLISALACSAYRMTGVSLEHIAVFLPLVLSALIAIPIWLMRESIGGALGAGIAIAFTLTAQGYTARTNPGTFDTDCLNPFFMLIVFWLAQRAYQSRGWRGVAYAVSGGLAFRLFMWWYDKPVLYYALAGMAVVMFAAHLRTDTPRLAVAKILILCALGFQSGAQNPFEWAQAYFSTNVAQSTYASGMPNVAISVSELYSMPLIRKMILVHGWYWALAGGAGLLWMLVSRRTAALFVLPIIGLGAMGVWSGFRFLIYTAPALGIGTGFIVSGAYYKIRLRFESARAVSMAALAALVIAMAISWMPPYGRDTYDPIFSEHTQRALESLRNEPRGIVWTWWDLGYAIQHVSRQATYIDGGANTGAYYVALSMGLGSEAAAYNTIQNVISGKSALGEKWGETSLDVLTRPAVASRTPVYVVFTEDMIDKYDWIDYFGRWDFGLSASSHRRNFVYLGTVPSASASGIFSTQFTNVNLRDGTITSQGESIALLGVQRASDDRGNEGYIPFPFNGNSFFVLELIRHGDVTDIFLINRDFHGSLFNRLYLIGQYDPAFFEPVYTDKLRAKIYRLR